MLRGWGGLSATLACIQIGGRHSSPPLDSSSTLAGGVGEFSGCLSGGYWQMLSKVPPPQRSQLVPKNAEKPYKRVEPHPNFTWRLARQCLRENNQPMLWQCEHTMRLCQPVASQVGHFCHALFVCAPANFPVQDRLARVRPQGWSIASAENENAPQRVQTATGCSRCWRDCKRDRAPERTRITCGAAVRCFRVSRKKLACMAGSH